MDGNTAVATVSTETDASKSGAAKKKDNVVKLVPRTKPEPKKPTGKDAKKITLLVKENPARKGTNRAKLWGKLKTGMTVAAAREAGVPARFLKKMVKAKNLK